MPRGVSCCRLALPERPLSVKKFKSGKKRWGWGDMRASHTPFGLASMEINVSLGLVRVRLAGPSDSSGCPGTLHALG